jgi:DNA repair photolyase
MASLDTKRRKGEHSRVPLIGIAKLAAESALLDAKSKVEYRELDSRRWIGRCSGERVPFQWTINPYRGCEFACRYCFARYTHEFMELSPGDDFETRIFAKKWSTSAFASELRRIPLGHAIGIGTATDPYQPAERRYGLTRRMLEVIAGDYGHRVSLITKSDLVARDADVIADVNRCNRMEVFVTITTLDRELARLLEPKAPRPDLRMAAVRALAEEGLRVGVTASPVLPGLNDSLESLEAIAAAAREAGATRFNAGALFLKPAAAAVFFDFLERVFPELLPRYRDLYDGKAFLRGDFPETIRRRVDELRRRYRFEADSHAWAPEHPQLPLFAA